MKLKQALLNCLLKEQLKDLCEKLEVEADRCSQDVMVALLASSKRAKVERLIDYMTVEQLKNALELMARPIGGRKEALIERLLATEGLSAAAVRKLELTNEQVAADRKDKPPFRLAAAPPCVRRRLWSAVDLTHD